MKPNARVSLAVISASALVLLLALGFVMYWSLTCAGSAPPDRSQEQQLRQELQSSAASLQRAHQELDAARNQTGVLEGTLARRLQELYGLEQKVFNLSSENQRLQDDLLSWKKNLSSTAEELREVKSIKEELQRQNNEYQRRVQQMELLLHNGSGRPKSARLFGTETLTVLLLLIFWVY
ncbi:uncharacterized protein LOC144799546 [Lissotriton helveticus]